MKQLFLYIERTQAVLKTMSNEQAGLLFHRLLDYVDGINNPCEDILVEAMFQVLQVDIDNSISKYEDICEKRRQAGKMHKGNQYTRKKEQKEQNGTNEPNVPNLEQTGLNISINKSISINNKSSINRTTLSEDNPIDLLGVINYWNEQLQESKGLMSNIKSITGNRKNSINARVKEHGKEAVKTVIDKATKSDFLNGRNDRGWIASFDWVFMHPNNFIKVLEGNYDNKTNISSGSAGGKQYQSASERVDAILGLSNNDEQGPTI